MTGEQEMMQNTQSKPQSKVFTAEKLKEMEAAYERVIEGLVEVATEEWGNEDKAIEVVADLRAVVYPDERDENTETPKFVGGILTIIDEEPTILLARRHGQPYQMSLKQWGRLAVADNFPQEAPPQVPVKGRLVVTRKGVRLFVAKFFDTKSDFAVEWPEGFFSGKGRLKAVDGKLVFTGLNQQEVSVDKVFFDRRKLPDKPIYDGIIYGFVKNGLFYVTDIRAGHSSYPKAVWDKLNNMIAMKKRAHNNRQKAFKAKTYVLSVVKTKRTNADKEQQNFNVDNFAADERTKRMLREILSKKGE